MTIKTIGVVGAGQMGNGIAHVFALAGYDVLLNDVDGDRITAGIEKIGDNMGRQVVREQIGEVDRKAALARITPAPVLTDIAKTDLVIEAATEKESVKRSIFEALVPHLKPETILTTNTSSISITRLASGTDRPERFMGFHFMNPVPLMQLVELIRGIATDEATFAELKGVVERLGKTPASAEDFPAFIVNFFFIDMLN